MARAYSTVIGLVLYLSLFAKHSPAQCNFDSVGWAELALISNFIPPNHHPLYPHKECTEKAICIQPNFKGRFVGPFLTKEFQYVSIKLKECQKFQGHLNKVLRLFKESFKGASREFSGFFKCFKVIVCVKGIRKSGKGVSWKFQQ